MSHIYALALGSNRPLRAHLTPPRLLECAMQALDEPPLRLVARSPIIASAPLGPSRRRYANAAVLITTDLLPPALLTHLKGLERHFGRRMGGQRWASRTLDLDILLWSAGCWRSPSLCIPHPHLAKRAFVLSPLALLAPRWRDPASGLRVSHILRRLKNRASRAICPVRVSNPLTTAPLPSRCNPSRRRGERALSSVGRATDF